MLRSEQSSTTREASGRDFPRSHLLTARSDTESFFASSNWVKGICFLFVAMKEPLYSLSVAILRNDSRITKKRIQTYG